MKDYFFKKNIELVRRFGREKFVLNKKEISFDEYLTTNEIEYFKIIEIWLAALIHWKKNSFYEKVKDRSAFFYRKFKNFQRQKKQKQEQKNIEKKSIIFFPIGETHVSLFEPIINELIKENEKVGILRFDYSMDGLKKELEKKKFDYWNFENYLDKKSEEKVKKIYAKYKNTYKIVQNLVKRNSEYEKLLPAFEYYFGSRKRFYEIISFVEGIRNFIEYEKPSLMFLPDETIDIAVAVSYLCKKNKTPCIVLQHGSITKQVTETDITYSNKKIVFGQTSKDFLVDLGIQSNEIEIVGNPVYDSFVNKELSKDEIKEMKMKLGINNEKIIVFGSTWNLERAEPRLKILFKIVRDIPGLRIIIKQHPSEYHQKKFEKEYFKLAKKFGVGNLVNISKDDMYKILSIGDIFITDFSTTILEALVLKKPIILINFEKNQHYESYPEFEGVISHTQDYEGVLKSIKYILKYKSTKEQELFRRKLIKQHIYSDDGKSTKRIISLIKKLIKK